MLFIDVKYANMIGSRLRNYKHKGEYLWNFSCPVCGDSKTNKLKARAYIYKVKAGLFCKCHNCGYSTNLANFLKYLDPVLHQEYILENYKENGNGAPRIAPKPVQSNMEDFFKSTSDTVQFGTDSVLDTIKPLNTLLPTHPALKYIRDRKIPVKLWSLLYYAPKFKHYVNRVVPGKFKNPEIEEHPRLIIPFFNKHGKVIAFQARAFGNEQPKYYTIKIDDNEEKIFGLDRVNYARPIYITEGPIDSLFLPNALAVSGSSFNTPQVEALKTNATIVYDNEPRSPELTKLIKKTIDQGFAVCLWPETMEYKDINEMVLAGYKPEELVDIIGKNTYSGVEAQLRFASWRKCG